MRYSSSVGLLKSWAVSRNSEIQIQDAINHDSVQLQIMQRYTNFSLAYFSFDIKSKFFPWIKAMFYFQARVKWKLTSLDIFFIEMVGDKFWQLICLYSDWLLAKFILVPWKKTPEYTCGQFEVFEHYILIFKSTLALCEFVRYWFSFTSCLYKSAVLMNYTITHCKLSFIVSK